MRQFIAKHIPVSDDLLGPQSCAGISADLSVVALQNNQLVGAFINQIVGETVHCSNLAIDPRNPTALPLLFEAVAKAGMEQGFSAMEFMTHPDHFPAMHAMLHRLEPESKTKLQGLELQVA